MSIDALGLRNDDIYRRYLAEGLYDGAADVARSRSCIASGVCTPTPIPIARRPLGGAPFMKAGFFAALEPNDEHPGLITNAFMGAVPEHPVTSRYIDAVSRVRTLRPMWRLTGPGVLTDILTAQDDPDVMILPDGRSSRRG